MAQYNFNDRTGSGNVSCALITLVFFATLGGFLFGYDTGVVSGVIIFWEDDSLLTLSGSEIEQLVSVTVGGAAVGAALSGMPLQWYGRKPLIMAASVLYIVASVVLLIANGRKCVFANFLASI
jgi:MFS transporter, SP family, solute carrier family 2 (myo-inositol transporter), member 13